MLSFLTTAPDPTVPTPTTAPVTIAPVGDIPSGGSESGSSVGDVVRTVIDNLGNNAYQTGVALIVATVAVVAMMNLRVNKFVLAPVTIGAFWFGWLGWNTVTGDENPLFPGDVSATKLWDVAFSGRDRLPDRRRRRVHRRDLPAGARASACTAGSCCCSAGCSARSFVYNLVESVQWN